MYMLVFTAFVSEFCIESLTALSSDWTTRDGDCGKNSRLCSNSAVWCKLCVVSLASTDGHFARYRLCWSLLNFDYVVVHVIHSIRLFFICYSIIFCKCNKQNGINMKCKSNGLLNRFFSGDPTLVCYELSALRVTSRSHHSCFEDLIDHAWTMVWLDFCVVNVFSINVQVISQSFWISFIRSNI